VTTAGLAVGHSVKQAEVKAERVDFVNNLLINFVLFSPPTFPNVPKGDEMGARSNWIALSPFIESAR